MNTYTVSVDRPDEDPRPPEEVRFNAEVRRDGKFHRRGRFDATITLHDGRDFGIVRQGLALRHRSLYDRLRPLAHYDYSRRPDALLILVPSVWERRLTATY